MILTIDTVPVAVPDPGQNISCFLCNSIISFVRKDPTRLFTHFQEHHQVHLNHKLLLSINLIDSKCVDEVISSGCKSLQKIINDPVEKGKALQEIENKPFEKSKAVQETDNDKLEQKSTKQAKVSESGELPSEIDCDTELKHEIGEDEVKCETDNKQSVKKVNTGSFDATEKEIKPKVIDKKIKEDTHKESCPYCKKVSTNKKVLSRHIRNHHGSEKYTKSLIREVFCHECKCTVDIDKISLIEHHYTVHYQKLKCKYCEELFRSEFRLSTHIKRRHGSENSSEILLCTHCGFSTYNLGENERHKNVHGSSQCEFCEKSFGNKYMLKQHVEAVHENKIKFKVCHICGQSCRAQSINDHIFRYHSTEIFNCPECEYTSSINTDVKRHYKSAHESVTRPCDDCGINIKFIEKHKRQSCSARTIKERIECNYCDATFGYEVGLRRHVKNIHMNIKHL